MNIYLYDYVTAQSGVLRHCEARFVTVNKAVAILLLITQY